MGGALGQVAIAAYAVKVPLPMISVQSVMQNGSSDRIELVCDLPDVATLKQKINDLLIAGSNGYRLHGLGIPACTWFEYPLCAWLVVSTSVTT